MGSLEELSAVDGLGVCGASGHGTGTDSVTGQHVAILKLRITNLGDDLMLLVIGWESQALLSLRCRPGKQGHAPLPQWGHGGSVWGRAQALSVGIAGGLGRLVGH